MSPVDAVRTPDGLVTIDNTRIAVAREKGLSEVPVRIWDPSDPLPADMIKRFKGPRTWGEALQRRLSKQWPEPLPPTGTTDIPLLPSTPRTDRNPISWLEPFLTKQGFQIPTELEEIIKRGIKEQGPFYFLSQAEEEEDTARMNERFKTHTVIAFGRRLDYDGVVCLVVADGAHPRGHVLVLHWDGWPGTEVDEHYSSLAEWAKSAEEMITHASFTPSAS